MQTLWFSFSNTRSAKILESLKWFDHKVILSWSDITPLEPFIEKYDLIIGVWDYSWVDQKQVRVESFCTNKRRNQMVDSNELLKYSLFIPAGLGNSFKIGKWMGNSYCNNACYKLVQIIVKMKSKARVVFLHIPKWINRGLIWNKIQQIVKDNF